MEDGGWRQSKATKNYDCGTDVFASSILYPPSSILHPPSSIFPPWRLGVLAALFPRSGTYFDFRWLHPFNN
jgi:hypothetical protein